jgi:hypothetical protein
MPVATTLAVVGAVAGGIIAGAGIATIAINAGIALVGSLVLGAVSKALQKKPKGGEGGSGGGGASALEVRDRTVTIRQPVAPRRVIYGIARVGGTFVFMGTSPQGGNANGRLNLVIAIAGHEVAEIGDIYFDDTLVPLSASGAGYVASSGRYLTVNGSLVYIEKFLGAEGQTASAALASLGIGWTTNHRLRGVAYLYVQLQYDADVFANGVPNITAIVRGKKCFDPRRSGHSASDPTTWEWHDNPAICFADYLTDTKFGRGATYADEISEADLIEAANVCDEAVTINDGASPANTEARFTCNGSFTTDQSPKEIMDDLLTAMVGSAVLIGGKWYIQAGAYKTPTIELDEDDLRGGIKTRNLVPGRESFNAIKGTFISPLNLWQPDDFPAITSDTFEDEDGGERKFKDISLAWTITPGMAQRIAKIDLFRARQPLTTVWPCKLTAWRLKPGDTVMLSNTSYGWSQKPFEVVAVDLVEDNNGYLGVDLTMRETDPSIYDWETSEEQEYDPAPNTDLPNPFDVGSPSNLAAESGEDQLLELGEGSILSRILFSWDAVADVFVREYEVEIKKSSESTWAPYQVVRRATSIYVAPVEDGETYDLRVRAVNELNVRGGFATLTGHTVIGKTEAPPAPDSFTVERTADGTRRYQWVLADEPPDVRSGGGYRIRYLLGATSDWDAMTALHTGTLKSSPYESNELAAGSYTFAIKTLDSSGNESDDAVFVSATIGDPRLRNVLLARSEHTLGWPGTKTNAYVDTDSALRVSKATGSPQGDWARLAGSTWSALSGRTWATITERSGTMVYTTPIIDLEANVSFTPLLSFVGGGTITTRVATGASGQSPTVDGFTTLTTGQTITNKRFVQFEITATQDITQLTILLDGDTQTDEFADINVATESAVWFTRVGAGHFRVGTKSGNMAVITMAQITAIQNAGGRATWELISKTAAVNGSPGTVAAEFKTYNAAGTLTDYTVDVELRGPKIQ